MLDELDRAQIGVASLSLHSASLDDVFLSLTGHKPASGTATHGDDSATSTSAKEIVHV